ncbi:MAG: hypothetical protein M3R06_07910 [Chloroflexota bacterium]|nr:hypothetical protein [Chloroflexota bacterium]
MVTQLERNTSAFLGSADSKRIAKEVLKLMYGHGQFMAWDTPIRVSLASLQQYFESHGGFSASMVERAVNANSAVFAIEEIDEQKVVVTTRSGLAAQEVDADSSHSFAARFATPLPKPETPPVAIRERPRIDPSWASLSDALGDLDGLDEDLEIGDEGLGSEANSASEFTTTTPPIKPPLDEISIDEEIPVAPVAVRAAPLGGTGTTDVTGVGEPELAESIEARLGTDSRVANFGDQWMLEERVPRFSRGELRRIKEYLEEQEQPLTDDVLVQDVLQVRPGTAEFDLVRFAVNFRLSREHREFDFVGTNNQRFWSTGSLAQIGTTRRKPNEIGTDYRFLTDELEGTAPRSITSIDRTLTFYEYYLGLLPYNSDLQALMPAPLLPDQRTAVLTFECPQVYTTYLVELRYPTPNRGGYVLGLDDFYRENLVPGALLSLARTDNDGHYILEYAPGGAQTARLLELDERRAPRYVFRPTTYNSGVDDSMLLTEERFPRLANEKPLDDRVRRRPEAVAAATFERMGTENEGHGYRATFMDIFAAVNIERPFSETLLRTTLDTDETGAFARDPDGTDAYTYVPGPNG